MNGGWRADKLAAGGAQGAPCSHLWGLLACQMVHLLSACIFLNAHTGCKVEVLKIFLYSLLAYHGNSHISRHTICRSSRLTISMGWAPPPLLCILVQGSCFASTGPLGRPSLSNFTFFSTLIPSLVTQVLACDPTCRLCLTSSLQQTLQSVKLHQLLPTTSSMSTPVK